MYLVIWLLERRRQRGDKAEMLRETLSSSILIYLQTISRCLGTDSDSSPALGMW
jgi:hypothetical protein